MNLEIEADTLEALRRYAATLPLQPTTATGSAMRKKEEIANGKHISRADRPGTRRPAGKVDAGKGTRGGARTVAMRRTAPVVREPVTLPSVLTVAELAEKLETTGSRSSRS